MYSAPDSYRERITVGDILGWLASGMSMSEIIEDFPELEENDIYAALSFAADRENKILRIAIARNMGVLR